MAKFLENICFEKAVFSSEVVIQNCFLRHFFFVIIIDGSTQHKEIQFFL